MARIAETHGIAVTVNRKDELSVPTAADATAALALNPAISHVAVVHSETTTGAVNPVREIGAAIKAARPDVVFVVDSMSGFGALPIEVHPNIDFLISSPNKCLEGVPGFAFVVAKREQLLASAGSARTLSLDLLAQWRALEADGQFRFTPPTQALLAFRQALREHRAEGGQAGRLARYARNFRTLKRGMAALGFHLLLPEGVQGCIVSTFIVPNDPAWDFRVFYDKLGELGITIYPGKLTKRESFRVGTIGRLFERDFSFFLSSVERVLRDMRVKLPVQQRVA